MPLKPEAINQIQPFAFQASVEKFDVLTLEQYISAVDRTFGAQKGVAKRELNNISMRQFSLICAGLAQFIANRYPQGVLDNNSLDDIENGLLAAINSFAADKTVSIQADAPLIGGGSLADGIIQLGIHQATTTRIGTTRLASEAETSVGTSEALAVTPKGLRQYAPADMVKSVNGTTPDANGNVTVQAGGDKNPVTSGTTSQGFFYTITKSVQGDAILEMQVSTEAGPDWTIISFPVYIIPATLGVGLATYYDDAMTPGFPFVDKSSINRSSIRIGSSDGVTPLAGMTGIIRAKVDPTIQAPTPTNIDGSIDAATLNLTWSN